MSPRPSTRSCLTGSVTDSGRRDSGHGSGQCLRARRGWWRRRQRGGSQPAHRQHAVHWRAATGDARGEGGRGLEGSARPLRHQLHARVHVGRWFDDETAQRTLGRCRCNDRTGQRRHRWPDQRHDRRLRRHQRASREQLRRTSRDSSTAKSSRPSERAPLNSASMPRKPTAW